MKEKTTRVKANIAARCIETLLALGEGNKRRVAREINLSPAVVSRITNGIRNPSKAFIARVAGHERVNASYLYDGEGSPLLPTVSESLPVFDEPLSGKLSTYAPTKHKEQRKANNI